MPGLGSLRSRRVVAGLIVLALAVRFTSPATRLGRCLVLTGSTLPPDRDGENDEPIYLVSVVSGKRNSRERAFAAARVYGPELREISLAYAIFQTGETRAADAASVRGSLGGLVKYGADWRRERGWLIYQGAGLKPDMVTIFRLTRENDELKRQASQEEVVSN